MREKARRVPGGRVIQNKQSNRYLNETYWLTYLLGECSYERADSVRGGQQTHAEAIVRAFILALANSPIVVFFDSV